MKFRRHWPWLLLLLPAALGLMRLRLDVEVMNLLPDDFPVVRGLKLYQTNFANARELIITVQSADADMTETAAREITTRLRGEKDLVAQATWQPLWMESPGQSAELIAYLWFNQPPKIFGELTNRLASTNLPALLNEARQALTSSLSPNDLAVRGYDPFGLTQLPESAGANHGFGNGHEFFSSPDGTFRVVFVEASRDIANYRRCAEWLDEVKAVVTDALATNQLSEKVGLRYTGRPAFVAEIASGMERDMTGSVTGTMLIVAGLFWWAHRRWRPLLWILALLTMILAATMALGGLIFGTLSVISMGFAAVLLGLAVDYGLVLYQEWRVTPEQSPSEIRHHVAPSVIWSAVTTAGAFTILNLGGLPGLGQLGTLVAIGVALAAVVMLFAYLPPLVKCNDTTPSPSTRPPGKPMPRLAWSATVFLLAAPVCLLAWRVPVFDNSADALRPRNSPAYAAVEEIKRRLERTQEPIWALVAGISEAEVAQRLQIAQQTLERAVSNHVITNFVLPTLMWPQPKFQAANRETAERLAARGGELRSALVAAGFTVESFALTENILNTWRAASTVVGKGAAVFWPTNANSRWVLEKFLARSENQFLALGLLYRDAKTPLAALTPRLLNVTDELAPHGIYVSGWEMLGFSLFSYVKEHFPRVLLPMFALLIVSLWLAFRRPAEMLLSLATLAFSGMLLWAIMAAAGWSWNLMNLMAVPLLLGSGVDYSIHMQLALRRHSGDVSLVRRSIGRALLLCGGTTTAAFGSLAWASNAGMASLGKVCATGIAACLFTSICLLPSWWRAVQKK